MPRPTILPIPNRRTIFEGGRTFEEWLKTAESPDQTDRIRDGLDEVDLPGDAAFMLKRLLRPVRIIAIAEPWCGDVVRHTPLLMRMVECTGISSDVRFVAPPDCPDFFARFLTNGGEAIPKFVFCNENFTETGNWGPMSSTPRKWIAMGKACGDVPSARQKVSEFYRTDNRRESIAELLELFQIASTASL